jgi:hypothetical protein
VSSRAAFTMVYSAKATDLALVLGLVEPPRDQLPDSQQGVIVLAARIARPLR